MKFEDIIASVKKKEYAPIYFLMGEEPYFIDEISNLIEKSVLQEHERDFNQTVMYGKDTSPEEIISVAKRFPMMSEHQVVIIKEAQNIRNIEQLESYIANPLRSTILVIDYKYKKLDKRKAISKIIAKNGVLFESVMLRDYQIGKWIEATLKSKKMTASPKVIQLLADYLGTDLSKISNELNKLNLILGGAGEITEALIQKHVGVSKDYNIFELQNAVGKKEVLKVNEIIHYFAQNPKEHSIIMVISSLFNYFSKILQTQFSKNKANDNLLASELKVNPYFVKDYKIAAKNYSPKKIANIISYLREYDVKSKGVDNAATTEEDLMRELMFKILH